MTIENWIVTGAVGSAVIYLGLRGYYRYKKEARQLQACQSCPVVKERREAAASAPPPDAPD